MVIGIPSGVTEVEKRAAHDAAINAGAREAYPVEEPMAAAIGAGLPVQEPIGSMIVDIGGGTTEVAVISLGGIVVNYSIRTAGDEIDEAVIQYARREHNLLIGERMAEAAKIAAGSAYPLGEEKQVTLRGRDIITGLPKAVDVSSVELREAISGAGRRPSSKWSSWRWKRRRPNWWPILCRTASRWPGAARCSQGLDRRLMIETRMPVHICRRPADRGVPRHRAHPRRVGAVLAHPPGQPGPAPRRRLTPYPHPLLLRSGDACVAATGG